MQLTPGRNLEPDMSIMGIESSATNGTSHCWRSYGMLIAAMQRISEVWRKHLECPQRRRAPCPPASPCQYSASRRTAPARFRRPSVRGSNPRGGSNLLIDFVGAHHIGDDGPAAGDHAPAIGRSDQQIERR